MGLGKLIKNLKGGGIMSQDIEFMKWIKENIGTLKMELIEGSWIATAGEFHGSGEDMSEALANLVLNNQKGE